MRVVVVGAGIGGLALARGLQRQGIDVVVLERDTDLRRTIGHSLQLHSPAMTGVQEMLPAETVRGLYAIAQGTWVETGYMVRDHQGRTLMQEQRADGPEGVSTDRVTLRLLLAAGLEDQLRLGVEVVGHEELRDGGVVAYLASGEQVTGDVLVAADGVGSPIAHSLAGRPTCSPTSLVGFAGRTSTAAVSPVAEEIWGTGATIAIGPGGSGLYVGHHQALDQEVVRSFSPSVLHPDPAYLWGAVMLEWAQTAPLAELDGRVLADAVSDQLGQRSWSPELIEVVERADTSSLLSFRFHAAPTYPAGIAPWSAGPVTALGDAVHAMPPTGGKGASTAIRDAHVLWTELIAARDGHRSVPQAVERYESQMRVYAARAVADALRPPAWSRTGKRGMAPRRETSLASAAVSWARRSDREPVGV